jgi:2-aminoadipate transaminase
MKSSVIRELLKFTQLPEVISFAGGMPAPELFPVREFEEACRHILRNEGSIALQYSSTEGYPPLKQWLADTMSKYDIWVELDNILLTNGSQQALDLLGKVFVEPGACLMTSAPTYLGALQAWNAYEGEYCTVPLDENGMCVEELPALLEKEGCPRFLYVLPNFHNPAGTTLPLERRERLAEIAREYDLILIEDDPYGELRYEGEYLTPLFCLAPERTIYLSTFSKTLAPGIRLDICQRGILRQHVKRLRQDYKERRDTMLEALEEHWPEECSWTRPLGGLFLWARVPEKLNTKDMLDKAVEQKVAYVPGFAFYPKEGDGLNTMRLNFSNSNIEQINEGIYRLGKVIKKELARA